MHESNIPPLTSVPPVSYVCVLGLKSHLQCMSYGESPAIIDEGRSRVPAHSSSISGTDGYPSRSTDLRKPVIYLHQMKEFDASNGPEIRNYSCWGQMIGNGYHKHLHMEYPASCTSLYNTDIYVYMHTNSTKRYKTTQHFNAAIIFLFRYHSSGILLAKEK